ncbi:MAG: tripartite tricarboxylate transporter TctB family protein [Deltaproteobacteria bacterium]|nr:tripartite tricarboxylate transporter TctB family protein [Deltaproteobacteria bacterium]
MNLRDQWSGLFWLIFAGLVGTASYRMGIGTFQVPGPGLLPLLAAGAVGLLALLLAVKGTLRKEEGGKIGELWTGATWTKVALVSAALLVYALVLTRLGFLMATFGLMTLLFSILGRARWWIRVSVALVTVLVAYAVFRVWLDVALPKGLLGL